MDRAASKVLDAIPSPIFLVDRDARVNGMNRAARAFLGPDAESALHRRSGEVLHCVNPQTLPGRCGETERCKDCVLRNSLSVIDGGPRVVRARHDMEVLRGDVREPVVFWITATALEVEGERLALVVLEEITELVRLKELVPICASCKKIRTGDDYWEAVEAYMGKHLDLTFTHGICPDCALKLYGEMDRDGK